MRLFVIYVAASVLCFAVTTALAGDTQQDAPNDGFFVLDPTSFRERLGSDYEWAVQNVPFIDFPHDQDILTSYYYRWRSFRKHIVLTSDDGYMVTEFLPEVPWAGKHGSIPAAAGHHIMEGRWIHDESILNDYIQFWLKVDATPAAYTNWIGYAAWQRYLLNGNMTFVKSLQQGLANLFRTQYVPKYLRNFTTSDSTVNPCWFQVDGYDAMEVSISGDGCRPTIASAMYGEAVTQQHLAKMIRNKTLFLEFGYWAALSRSIVLDLHWNPAIESFAVIPIHHDENAAATSTMTKDAALAKDTVAVSRRSSCDLGAVRQLNKTVQVRELLAFMPWYFETLIPSNSTKQYMPMWRQLFDPNGYAAHYGLRTAEYRHQCYNYSWDHGDCWNGPSWPYETSRVLTAAANVLNGIVEEKKHNTTRDFTKEGYWMLLEQYARQHTRTSAVNDTAVPRGSGHVFENLHPDLGYWNNRNRMYWRNDQYKDMGDDYNHSTFIDLILSGLLGIRPQKDGTIVVNPLILVSKVPSFAVDHVRIRGDRILSITWSKDGFRYSKGLTVLVNGMRVAYRSSMGPLRVNLGNSVETN